ncbi:MAG: hypothetical protein ABR899_09780 [Candidatus Krumholzibacteriaceae bacterium]|jgi:hypothetical protein
MKKLALGVLLVMAFSGSAFAHNGALSLYTDQTISICDMTMGALETHTINMYYVKDQGVNLGNAVEFRLTASDPRAIFTNEAWNPLITLALGTVDGGISLTASNCLGGTENVTFIGGIDVFWADVSTPPTFTVNVVPDQTADPPGIYVLQCNGQQTRVSVLGGTFVFNGSCNPGVQPKSWGAIKDLYR